MRAEGGEIRARVAPKGEDGICGKRLTVGATEIRNCRPVILRERIDSRARCSHDVRAIVRSRAVNQITRTAARSRER